MVLWADLLILINLINDCFRSYQVGTLCMRTSTDR